MAAVFVVGVLLRRALGSVFPHAPSEESFEWWQGANDDGCRCLDGPPYGKTNEVYVGSDDDLCHSNDRDADDDKAQTEGDTETDLLSLVELERREDGDWQGHDHEVGSDVDSLQYRQQPEVILKHNMDLP